MKINTDELGKLIEDKITLVLNKLTETSIEIEGVKPDEKTVGKETPPKNDEGVSKPNPLEQVAVPNKKTLTIEEVSPKGKSLINSLLNRGK